MFIRPTSSQQGEAVLTVPTALLRSLDSTPKPIVRALKGATVHAILAAALCLESDPEIGRAHV